MQFSFTDEQEQFRDMIRRFTRDHSPTTEVRRLMETDSGFDPSVWKQLTAELGLAAIQIPEEHGGAGFGAIEVGIVMEELGRSLLCAPYFSSAVVATAAINFAADPELQAELLPGLADGSQRATLALIEANGSWELDQINMSASAGDSASADGSDYRLTGEKSYVIDGHTADVLLVAARRAAADGLSLFLVDAAAPGLERALLPAMDGTRKLASLRFDSVPARLIGSAGGADPVISSTLDLAAIGLANEMVGGAQALLDSAVAYAKMRVQFGRTIGSFQAIKHKCAEMLLDVESARSAAYCAAAAAAENDPEAPALACLAKAAASDTYLRTAAETIQIHGGIGFTWENDTHLWFKRAKSSEVLLGDPSLHRERMMQRWGY